MVAPTHTVRYLGHIAGTADTTEKASEMALNGLKVILVIVETKPNTNAVLHTGTLWILLTNKETRRI